jgi:ketosteroid isomerase-like protein
MGLVTIFLRETSCTNGAVEMRDMRDCDDSLEGPMDVGRVRLAPDEEQEVFMSDRDEITKVGHELAESIRAYDVDGMTRAYAPDAVIMPPNQSEVSGSEAIRAWFQAVVDRFRIAEYLTTTSELATMGDWGLRRGAMAWKLAPKQGGDVVHLDTKFLQVWKRQTDGAWKIFRGIWNSNDPAAR